MIDPDRYIYWYHTAPFIREGIIQMEMRFLRLLILIILAGSDALHAQNAITLTFTAALNGPHQPLDSIKILNLTLGGDTSLHGNDTVLQLDFGIGMDEWTQNGPGQWILFPITPNPASQSATLSINLPKSESAVLKAADVSGRELAAIRLSLPEGIHAFTFTPGQEALYFLSVEVGNRRQVQKLVSLQESDNPATWAYYGYQGSSSQLRMTRSVFPWFPGDHLRFIGYTLQGNDTINAEPLHSTQYTFHFKYIYPPGYVHCNPGSPTAVAEVTNPVTGKTWMDRNLGATQVATSSVDSSTYGDTFQWGRFADGHQCRTSATTATLSPADQPGHGNYILAPNAPYDWRSPQNPNLWQGVNGVNNPCPIGYRLPTEAELDAERLSWSSNNAAGAFASPLKLPQAGNRGVDGQFYTVGSYGNIWSSTVSSNASRYLMFRSNNAYIFSVSRASGFSVRCLKGN